MHTEKRFPRGPRLVMALAFALAGDSAWLPVARAVGDEGPASVSFSAGARAKSESTKASGRALASVAALPLPSPDAVLYDQYNNETDWGFTSQDLTDAGGRFDALDNMAADDFQVPDHFQWRVATVDVMGHYLFNRNLLEGMNVSIFENDPSSMKPAAAICSYSNLTPALDDRGSLRIDLPTPCLVREGHYWVSVQAGMPWLGGAGDQWFWRQRSAQSSEKAKWRNPSNGLGTGCVDWTDTASCDAFVNYPDLVFRLLGTSEVMPVEVDVSTQALTPNQDGWYTQNPVDVSFNIRCPAGTASCGGRLSIEMGSAGDVTRFYVNYAQPGHPFGTCSPTEIRSSSYTLRRLTLQCPSFVVAAGQSVVTHLGLWVQPSAASSFEVSARWEGSGEDIEKVRVDAARIHPVIFIPGILGTMPPTYQDEGLLAGRMDPNLDSYTPLLTTLEKMGYERGASLFPFRYDWRQSNDLSALHLKWRIPEVLAIANQEEYVGGPSGNATRVDLVVHSMGGLITRAYVQGAGYSDNVRKALFIASPHKGFPATYRTYEGMTWNMYLYDGLKQQALRLAMDLYIWPNLIRKKYSPSLSELELNCVNDPFPLGTYFCLPWTLAKWSHHPTRGIESLAQMLPTSDVPDYLTCADLPFQNCPQTVNPYDRPPNEWLDRLNQNVGTLADQLGLDNIYVIYGTGSSTETDYEVGLPLSPFYRNGLPTTINRSMLGDDLIPTYSTNLKEDLLPGIPESNVKKLSGPTARHKEIVYSQQVQQSLVPTFLGAMDLPFSTEYESELVPWDAWPLIFSLQCPLNLTVTDPQERKVGYDLSTGGSVVEIPGAIYAGPNVEGQYIILPGSPEGTYRIDGTAFGTGEYRLEVARLEPNGPKQLAVFSGTVSTGGTVSFSVDVEDFDTPPTIRSVVATPDVLWPVNHQMMPVSVAADVSDDLDPSPVCRIVSVAGSEPGNAPGDGNTGSDWNITGPLTLELRAERSGRSAGRTYTITVECADASGNRSEAPVTVRVPHDQRRK